jgi:hypothetical protein
MRKPTLVRFSGMPAALILSETYSNRYSGLVVPSAYLINQSTTLSVRTWLSPEV